MREVLTNEVERPGSAPTCELVSHDQQTQIFGMSAINREREVMKRNKK